MNTVTVKSPAKLNLSLNIVSKLSNGYHEMDMLMQSVSLFETAIISKSDKMSLECVDINNNIIDDLPCDEKNIAYKSAKLFFENINSNEKVKIKIIKATPMQAGMGGGSADAAAVLVGLNHLYGNYTKQELCNLGVKLGADVPFAILGGTLRATGIGDVFEKVTPLPECYFVVGMPYSGVSTKNGFENFDKYGVTNPPNTNLMVKYLQENKLDEFCTLQHNVMQESCKTEHTDKICSILKECGAKSALMTGSGSAVYGIFDNKSLAEQGLHNISKLVKSTYLLKPFNCGTYIVD